MLRGQQEMHSDATGRKGFVPILPARSDASTEQSTSDQANNGKEPPQLPLKRPRKAAGGRFACDACRARKTACNGELPCSTCVKRKLQCSFTARPEANLSQRERNELEELRKENDQLRMRLATTSLESLDTISAAPKDEALALFHQLRATEYSKAPSMITGKDIPLPDKESLEFELMMRHPLPYPIPPLQSSMSVPVPEAWILSKPLSVGLDDEVASTEPDSGQSSSVSLSDHYWPQEQKQQADASGSSSPSALCDERLGRFKIHSWLQTRASTSFAARVISHYLVTDHPTLGLFDADLFLDDLVANKIEFCSPLLLGALLAFACQGYSKFESHATSLSFEFFTEAERLYREEKTVEPQYDAAVMTVAAAQLLSLAALQHGNQAVSQRYMHDGIQLGCENGMLAVGKTHSARNWLDDHILNVRAASHTAWGTFCWSTILGMSYRNMFIDIHPWLPIPGTAIKRSGGDSVDFPLPRYMGQSFTHLCHLVSIIRQVLGQYYSGGDGLTPRIRTSEKAAEHLHKRLMDWADALPATMATIGITPSHVTVVHLYLHAAICDIFRPLACKIPPQPVNIHRCTAKSQTANDVYLASINQLKHLILIFRTQYPHATTSLGWHNALLYIANACILQAGSSSSSKNKELTDMNGISGDKMTEEQRRDWFLICVDAYRDLAPQFALVEGILQELLGIACDQGLISADEAHAMMLNVKMMAPLTPHIQYKGPHINAPLPAPFEGLGLSLHDIGAGAGGVGGLLFDGEAGTSAAPDAGRQQEVKFLVDLNSAQVDDSDGSLESESFSRDGESFSRAAGQLRHFGSGQNLEELAMFHDLKLGWENV